MITKLAFTAYLGATVAMAQPAPQAPTQTQSEATAKQSAAERKICRKLPSTGTRMEKRACLTLREWQDLDRQDD